MSSWRRRAGGYLTIASRDEGVKKGKLCLFYLSVVAERSYGGMWMFVFIYLIIYLLSQNFTVECFCNASSTCAFIFLRTYN